MSVIGRVEAVLIGRALPGSRPGHQSAIDKRAQAGPVPIGTQGLAGDEQGDRRVHGGADKAVHFYASEHYPRWRAELGDLPVLERPGAFGENLALSGVDEHSICLGDRLGIGTSVLEVTQGRQPCWKLNDRFGVPDMARRLQDSLRTGGYCRVLQTGECAAGDEVVLLARPHSDWPIARLMAVLYRRCLDPQILADLLTLPLVPGGRRLIEQRQAQGQIEDWQKRLEGPPLQENAD
jgi:MOSC domain-containing protein YiiM